VPPSAAGSALAPTEPRARAATYCWCSPAASRRAGLPSPRSSPLPSSLFAKAAAKLRRPSSRWRPEASQRDGTGRGAHLDELLHVNAGVDNVTPSAATLGESRHTVADLLSPIELR